MSAETLREPTRWPICTANGHWRNTGHVGNEDYSEGSPSWAFVDPTGNATCSCCDPVSGFPCTAADQSFGPDGADQ